jgi:hypothetical protein
MSPLKKPNNFEEKLKDQLDGMEWKPSESLWNRIEQNMSADSFEPTIQSKLENYQVKPTEKVWESVEAQLPESRRRKGIFWFGSIALLLLTTFGAGYWFNTISEPKTIAVNQPLVVENKPNTTQINPIPEGIKPNNETIETIIISKAPEAIAMEKKELKQKRKISTLAPIADSSVLDQTEKKLAKRPASNKQTNKNKTAKSNTKKVVLATNLVSENSNGIISPIVTETSSILGEPAKSNELSQTKELRSANNENGSNHIAKDASPKLDSSKSQFEPKVIQESANFESNAKDTFSENKLFRGTSYIAPEESFTNFSLSVYAGMHMSFMQTKMPSSSNYSMQKSFDLRNEMETPGIDFAGGLLLNYHFGKGWFVSSGTGIVAFKQIVKFSVMPANQSNPSYIQSKNLYINLSDSIIAGNSNTLENKYSFTEIPLWVGYQFPSDGSVHFELMGGLSYGRLNLVNAYMTDPGCIGILVVNDKESFPQFQNVFFASIAPSVSYKINSSVELGLMPNLKFGLNNMVKNEQWIQQKPALLGINFTLRKHF